jgi:hypothetical protein
MGDNVFPFARIHKKAPDCSGALSIWVIIPIKKKDIFPSQSYNQQPAFSIPWY